ncbi:MAG: hypothetical protein QW611_03425, partial [Ignisphaera sp.]
GERQRKDQAPPRKRSICANHSRRITSPNINLYKTRNSCTRHQVVVMSLDEYKALAQSLGIDPALLGLS